MNWNIVIRDEIDSTNMEARRMAVAGASEGTVIVADMQTSGKGRNGRTWESPKGGNLYFSLLLRPNIHPNEASMLTIVMAYSVAEALKKYLFYKNPDVQIKWPNDLLLADKKICGILTEMHIEKCSIEDVVIGVGINLTTEEFPEELKEKATSVLAETGEKIHVVRFLEEILQVFEKQYEVFLQQRNLSFIQESYNEMLVNKGREVKVLEPENEYEAVALGMNESGELVIQKRNGSIENIYAGEVSVRGIYGYI